MPELGLLVVLAHPDDESFPIGGTLARYAAEGVRVTLVCATKGEVGIPGLPLEIVAGIRERELRCAASALGVADVRFLGYRDGEVAQVDPETAVKQLGWIMVDLQPQVVITFGPDGISGHPDHVAIHRLTRQAFERAGIPARLFYIAPSEATQQGCGVTPAEGSAGGPVVAIDVGEHLVDKARAMQCHASQSPPYHGDPAEAAAHLACHEYFTLAYPDLDNIAPTDLFESLPSSAGHGLTVNGLTVIRRDSGFSK